MRTPLTSLLALALTCTLPVASIAAELNISTARAATPATAISWEESLSQDSMASPWVTQVCKLVEAGTDQNVVLAFIDTAGSFSLNWKQIVRLREMGVPNEIVSAMLSHDTQLSAGLLPPPAPPAGQVMPRKLVLTNSLSLTPPKPTQTEDDTIVNPSPAPELVSFYGQSEQPGLLDLTFNDLFPGLVSLSPGSPVREPYPVPLTDPIRVYRAAFRRPNIQVLEWFP